MSLLKIDTIETKTTIHDWLQGNVGKNVELFHDYLLIDKGLLTSVQVMELVMFIEDRFGITVGDEDIVEENFATLDYIAGLVESKGG